MADETDTPIDASTGSATGFRIFRRRDAIYGQNEHLRVNVSDENTKESLRQLVEVQGPHAAETSYLFGGNGMSLNTAWFKSGYPVTLHSHDADCLYYIVSGSLKLGRETLDSGDGFFVPSGVPYTYTAGQEGVEVLEFRTKESVDIRFTSSNPAYWSKAFASIEDRRDAWEIEPRPPRRME